MDQNAPMLTEHIDGLPVTMIVRRHIQPGKETEFEAWQNSIAQASRRYPGHMGVTTLRLPNREYATIFRFDTVEHLTAWECSAERQEWLRRAEPLLDGEQKAEKVSGLEGWFTLPDVTAPPPPRYKMAFVTYLAITPLVYFAVLLLNPPLEFLPPFVRMMITSAVTTALMTWVIMPNMTRLFKKWLYPQM
jgi:uncharacterized protein